MHPVSASSLPRSAEDRTLLRSSGSFFRAPAVGSLLVLLLVLLTGCSHFGTHSRTQYVYVIAKQSPLRERLAAVSNFTGEVKNGERLVLLERDRRFVKVRAPGGAVGWMEARLTADQALADQFVALGRAHRHDPVVAKATAENDVYMHIAPGRDADRFYRLSAGDAMSLLERASVPRPLPPGAAIAQTMQEKSGAVGAKGTKGTEGAKGIQAAPAPAMEDWWLVRDARGQTGWVYSRLIDVSVPDTLERYAEGQRIVGAYVLTHVDDPDSGMIENGQTVTSIPEYVTAVAGWKAGLPYDFDQVRVFIWNIKKHRYETSLRERNFLGYLPVSVSMRSDPYGKGADAALKLPTFSYRVLAAGVPAPAPNPATGLFAPAQTVTVTYRLEGNLCRRVLPPGEKAPEVAHPVVEKKKERARRRR